jgi:hypothetical protein
LSCPFLHSIPCQKAVLSVELKPWTQFMNSSTVAPLSATAKFLCPAHPRKRRGGVDRTAPNPASLRRGSTANDLCWLVTPPLPARARLQGAFGRCGSRSKLPTAQTGGGPPHQWVFNVERPAWLRHEESGRSSAEHGAKKARTKPANQRCDCNCGKERNEPGRPQHMDRQRAAAPWQPQRTRKRGAYAPTVPGRSAGTSI